MKKNDLLILRSKKVGELRKDVLAKKTQLLKKNDRNLRREVAQVLTLIREREIEESESSKK